MSSRAIRKALKQKEAATLVAQTKGNASDAEAVGSEDDNEDEDAKPRVNLFAMLNDNNEDEDDEAKLDDNDEEEAKAENPKTPSTPKKNKKKKRKGKGTGASSSVVASSGVDTPAKNGGGKKKETEDEIDRALRALNLKQAGKAGASSKSTPAGEEESDATLQRLLKIDSRNLDSTQEMKRLFGRTAISASDEDGGGLRQRRGQAGRRGVGIAGAVAGRGGTGRLLGMKRNIFVQPHDNWPLGNSGGLGMELVTEKDGECEIYMEGKQKH